MKYYFGIIAVIIMLFIGVKLVFPGTSNKSTTKSSVSVKKTIGLFVYKC